ILGLAVPFLNSDPKMTFLITAGFFTLFGIPMFLFVPEERRASSLTFPQIAKKGFSELSRTFRHIREYKDITRFLIAFFLYNDAILTVSSFSGIYAKETLHFAMVELAGFFAMIQIIAVIGSILFGKLADRYGSKRMIAITLFIWIAVIAGAYFTTTKLVFYFVGAGAGIALGASQSCSRSLMALLTPKQHTAEFFGFYDGFCGKVSAIIGPVLFGIFSDWFGDQRPAILILAPMIIIGLILLMGVREQRPAV
ncbi:MAG TPA: MFS transporter, partial [Candidatus Kapabacteria bacterium]